MRQERRLGLPFIAQGGKPVIDGLVEVAVPGADEAQIDVGHGSARGSVR